MKLRINCSTHGWSHTKPPQRSNWCDVIDNFGDFVTQKKTLL